MSSGSKQIELNQVIQTENNQSECIQKATEWRAASPRKKIEGILEE